MSVLDDMIPSSIPVDVAKQLSTKIQTNEVVLLWSSYSAVFRTYAATVRGLTRETASEPVCHGDVIDASLKVELVSLSKSDMRHPLKKLAWLARAMVDYEEDAGVLIRTAIFSRIAFTDFLLTEFRDLNANKGKPYWPIQVLGPNGVKVIDRVFPLWEVEHMEGLKDPVTALAWYRTSLKDRKVIG